MSTTPRTDKTLWEGRVYERERVTAYRFRGRYLSGAPKDLQVLTDDWKWEPCPNTNISIRIQKEDVVRATFDSLSGQMGPAKAAGAMLRAMLPPGLNSMTTEAK